MSAPSKHARFASAESVAPAAPRRAAACCTRAGRVAGLVSSLVVHHDHERTNRGRAAPALRSERATRRDATHVGRSVVLVPSVHDDCPVPVGRAHRTGPAGSAQLYGADERRCACLRRRSVAFLLARQCGDQQVRSGSGDDDGTTVHSFHGSETARPAVDCGVRAEEDDKGRGPERSECVFCSYGFQHWVWVEEEEQQQLQLLALLGLGDATASFEPRGEPSRASAMRPCHALAEDAREADRSAADACWWLVHAMRGHKFLERPVHSCTLHTERGCRERERVRERACLTRGACALSVAPQVPSQLASKLTSGRRARAACPCLSLHSRRPAGARARKATRAVSP